MPVSITLGRGQVDVGEAKPLFGLSRIGPRITYDVSPDGQRILAVTQQKAAATAPLTVVVNWPDLLKR
jgi:hypothetical protein